MMFALQSEISSVFLIGEIFAIILHTMLWSFLVDHRPVPLQHFVFPSAAEGLYLVVDEKGKFREDNFQRAMSTLQQPAELEEKAGKKKRKSGGNSSSGDLFKIVRLVMERELDPCIVFSFSKKECELYALQMAR